LYEKNNDIISQASYINQYRLHRGYHYPRSKDTAIQSQWGEYGFLQEYGDAIVNGDVEHYYAIAKEDSLVNDKQYKKFLDDMNLYHKEKELDFMHKNVVDLIVEVKEFLFDPNKLRDICWDKLNKYDVDVQLDTEFLNSDEYDYVVNSTYANLNQLLTEDKQKDYQFELCEKPVIKLPKQYKNKSVVIMDGPFMCIDPLGDTGLHVMGNVVHAIHSTNIGKFPKYDSKFDGLLNKGIVKNPSITNIDKFIDSAKKFFIGMDEMEHIGSMFTFRTVLPNKEKDDARPTLVEKTDDNTFTIFSGKIGTCVNAAEEILEYI
jgi:D-amino-acid oxidase